MKVLVADDSAVSLHLLKSLLEKWEYEVLLAHNGEDAWSILTGPEAPKLAILDWMMPGVTGPEICRRLRRDDRDVYTYVILVTSKGHKNDVIEGMEAGADDYITKPFDLNELKLRVRAGKRIIALQDALLRARESLQEQASRDPLTCVWNRSAIFDILSRELARGQREGTPVGIVMVDLDRFKEVNDSLGHLAGDAVLREAAARMQSSLRPYDSIGRFGGEEFLVVLPGCSTEISGKLADRMRQMLSAAPLHLEGEVLTLTASFGATSSVSERAASLEDLVRTADQALYEAKRAGRNCVVTSPGGVKPDTATAAAGPADSHSTLLKAGTTPTPEP